MCDDVSLHLMTCHYMYMYLLCMASMDMYVCVFVGMCTCS